MIALLLAPLVLFVFIVLIALFFRTVVSTNDVHIVQSAKRTVSYGKDQSTGNTYYAWPSWIPRIGIKVIRLPVSVFSVDLDSYDAYDKGRVPFVLDILAFFRIEDANTAAQRVHSFDMLREQLKGILQGATRNILAKSEIEDILEKRSEFGEMFTEATREQLKAWGVMPVKSIELMDIRDAPNSKVIANIMAKKQSLIERESRVAVAENTRVAKEAEIVAARDVAMRDQEAQQQVGIRIAEKDQQIGVARELSLQTIKDQAKVTAEKDMAVKQVNDVRAADIHRQVAIVAAERERQVNVVTAEGDKQATVTVAEGKRDAQLLSAQGIEAVGKAEGEAEKAKQLAPVAAQVTLAKEIGSNQGYQQYLISIRQVEASQAVGIEAAKALHEAEIKVIANTGDNAATALGGVMELFSAKGGQALGAALEAFKNTPAGEQALNGHG